MVFLTTKITHLSKVHGLLIMLSLHMMHFKESRRMNIEKTFYFIVVGCSLPRNDEIAGTIPFIFPPNTK